MLCCVYVLVVLCGVVLGLVVREYGVGNPRWICDVMLQCMLVGECYMVNVMCSE